MSELRLKYKMIEVKGQKKRTSSGISKVAVTGRNWEKILQHRVTFCNRNSRRLRTTQEEGKIKVEGLGSMTCTDYLMSPHSNETGICSTF